MTIPVETIEVFSWLCGIIVTLIVALSHMYVKLIRNDIKRVHHRIDPIEEASTDAHKRIDEHVKDYHTVKS